MIAKELLRIRLSKAIGKTISKSEFTWFFACFCNACTQPKLIRAKELTEEEVRAFSRYAGYDLRFDIPIPLW